MNAFIPDTLFNDSVYQLKMDEFYSYVNKLSTYVTDKKKLDIILVKWREEKNRRAFGVALGNHSVFDIAFPASSMLHEVIHQAFPTNILDLSNGEYFIKESIVEWLALFLSDKLNKIDSSLINNEKINLYDTKINNPDTWHLIYAVGPAILQEIANQTSAEQLACSIISFIKKKEAVTTNYVEFILHLKTCLPLTSVNKLDLMVRGENILN